MMAVPRDADREEVARYSQLLWEKGWVANHDGNVTARLTDGNLLATATALSKRVITAREVLLLAPDGSVIEGELRPFSELVLHRVAYRVRDDARAILHAHPPYASGFAIAGEEIEPTVTPEAVVSLGDRIPCIAHRMPGDPALLEAFGAALVDYDAVLLDNHGVFTVGEDLEQAFLRMELVEHLAHMSLVSRQLGRIRRIPRDHVEALLQKRAKAGLGPIGRAAKRGNPDKMNDLGDLATLIASELKTALATDTDGK